MSDALVTFDIEVIIELGSGTENTVAAATYNGFYIPEGELLPAEKDAVIDSQAYVDYEDFIESVEDLITDYFELHIYYKNKSKDFSRYFGMVVKDDEGNVVANFNFNLRISNHDPHRSKRSQQHKKESNEALAKITKKKLQPITKSITINREKFVDYTEAYIRLVQKL